MAGLVIEAASKEGMSKYESFPEICPEIQDRKTSVLSREKIPYLKIEDDHPPVSEKKQKLGTGVAEREDVGKGGGSASQSFKIVPVHDYDDCDEVLEMFMHHLISDPDSDEDYGLDGSSEFDADLWNKCHDQINKSEGFDIDLDVYPGCCDMAAFQPIPYFKDFPELLKDLEAFTDLALQSVNTEHSTRFEFVEIEKVVQRDWHYYLTFKAKDPEEADADAALKTFQARVYDGFGGPDVELCRIKN